MRIDIAYIVQMVVRQKWNRYAGIIPGLIAFLVYYSTACRSIWIGDSGEFALALKTMGICHPPGYPLFSVLGRLFLIILPFLRPIFAAGIYNVVIGAAAVSVIYLIFRKSVGILPAILISLTWAFSPIFWDEIAGVEIYSLNLLLLSLIILVLESGHRRKWPIAFYLFGLSLANHPSALAIFPALIYLFAAEKEFKNIRSFPLYLILLLLPAGLYLYLPIRASFAPISNWGNPVDLNALLRHMTLAQYKGWINYSMSNLLFSAKLFYFSLVESWKILGLIVVIVGAAIGIVHQRKRTIIALLILIMSIIMASSHRALNYQPFYLPAMLAALLLAGNILVFFESKIRGQKARITEIAILAAGCLILLIGNYRSMDRSDYTLAEDYGRDMLETAKAGVLFTAGDINSFPALYLRYAENETPLLQIYDRSIRLSALISRAEQISSSKVNDYTKARSIVLESARQGRFLSKNHYILEPGWPGLSEPYFSCGILYEIGIRHSNCSMPMYISSDYEAGDVLSRQLLVNLDLSRGEQILSDDSTEIESATAAFNSALARLIVEPQAVVLSNLGIYLKQIGFYDLALQTYDSALTRPIISSNDKADIMLNISNVYKAKGNDSLSERDFQNAIINFEKALQYDKNNTDLILNIGLIYGRMLNNTEKAREYIGRYLEFKPSDKRARAYYDSLKK